LLAFGFGVKTVLDQHHGAFASIFSRPNKVKNSISTLGAQAAIINVDCIQEQLAAR